MAHVIFKSHSIEKVKTLELNERGENDDQP